jgi:hypothetical protein
MARRRRFDVRLELLAVAALMSLALAGAARANTISVAPASEGTQIEHFNTTITFVPGIGQVATIPDYAIINGAVVFDLSFIPAGTTITGASFTVSVNGSQSGGELAVYSYTAPSNLVTMSDFPFGGILLGNSAPLPLSAPPGSIDAVTTLDATSFIQSLVTNGTPYAGFLLEAQVTDGGYNLPGTTPISLSITSPSVLTVPEPPGAVLMALGLTGLLIVISVRAPRRARPVA